jgi:hypothetical protein
VAQSQEIAMVRWSGRSAATHEPLEGGILSRMASRRGNQPPMAEGAQQRRPSGMTSALRMGQHGRQTSDRHRRQHRFSPLAGSTPPSVESALAVLRFGESAT